jgi:hypothetical protein
MTILLETEFSIGDIVASKLDEECTYIVCNINILQVDSNGTATMYSMDCSGPDGACKVFRPYELKIIEKVIN